MNIEIYQLIEGAKKARGIAVIIDVFRAFSLEAYLSDMGVSEIVPVGDMDIAYAYRKSHPEALLIGERHGVMLPGFDYGNSPSQVQGENLAGRTVVHTTSAGTQGIANAEKADEVLTGSLVNAAAIARYIKEKNPKQVSLVCMGVEAVGPSDEDTLCAEYIRALLRGEAFDLAPRIGALKYGTGARFFDPAHPESPEEDFYLCTKPDIFDFILRAEECSDGLRRIRRIDMGP